MKRNYIRSLNGVDYLMVYDTEEQKIVEAHVSGLSKSFENKKHIRILHEVDGVPVVSVLENAFANTRLESVILPAIELRVDKNAFQHCVELRSVFLISVSAKHGVISLCDSAFGNCFNLTKIKALEKIYLEGEFVFYNCKKLHKLPVINLHIPDYSFYNCDELREIVVDNYCQINHRSFENASIETVDCEGNIQIKKVTVKKLSNSGISFKCYEHSNVLDFGLTTSIKPLPLHFEGKVIRNGIVYDIYWEEAEVCGFSNKNDTRKDLIIPDYIDSFPVTQIKNRAFYQGKFESLQLPWRLNYVGKCAFYLCENLKKVTSSHPNILSDLKSNNLRVFEFPSVCLDDEAFCLCKNLITVDVFQYLRCHGKYVFAKCENLESTSMLEELRNHCFDDCEKMTQWNLAWNADVSAGSLSGNLKKISCKDRFGCYTTTGSIHNVFWRLEPGIYEKEDAVVVQTPSLDFYETLCKSNVKAELIDESQFSILEKFAGLIDYYRKNNISEVELEQLFSQIW